MRKSFIKYSFCLFLLLLSCTVFSQAVLEVINAERAFAKAALDQSTKYAFVKNLDSSGVVFNNGKALNGLEVWNKRTDNGSKLFWYPVFAGAAASGDLGFTTGPWYIKKSLEADTVLAQGYFTTIWHKNNGEWKVLADLGTETPVLDTLMREMKTWQGQKSYAIEKDPLQVEQHFIEELKKDKLTAYTKYFADNPWFNIKGNLPLTSSASIVNAIKSQPGETEFTPLKSGISSTGDLLYVYGTTTTNGKQENYLRVWVKQNNHFRLILQVLR